MRITHAPIAVACFRLESAAHNEGAEASALSWLGAADPRYPPSRI
jgi:hypothetical protein